MDPMKDFQWGNFVFLELTNGKIRCGVCQEECTRLIKHMRSSPECSNGIDMEEFKTSLKRFKDCQRKAKMKAKMSTDEMIRTSVTRKFCVYEASKFISVKCEYR